LTSALDEYEWGLRIVATLWSCRFVGVLFRPPNAECSLASKNVPDKNNKCWLVLW